MKTKGNAVKWVLMLAVCSLALAQSAVYAICVEGGDCPRPCTICEENGPCVSYEHCPRGEEPTGEIIYSPNVLELPLVFSLELAGVMNNIDGDRVAVLSMYVENRSEHKISSYRLLPRVGSYKILNQDANYKDLCHIEGYEYDAENDLGPMIGFMNKVALGVVECLIPPAEPETPFLKLKIEVEWESEIHIPKLEVYPPRPIFFPAPNRFQAFPSLIFTVDTTANNGQLQILSRLSSIQTAVAETNSLLNSIFQSGLLGVPQDIANIAVKVDALMSLVNQRFNGLRERLNQSFQRVNARLLEILSILERIYPTP